ncbi:MAG: ABC transporter substrate-binding protein [Dehalococcoidia bacterium]|nr:ABC transporter substrate-binding protein [Dehalococcoidia bacterium]
MTTGSGNGGNGQTPSPNGNGNGEIQTGGTLTMRMAGSPRSLDPHFDTFPYNTQVTTNTYNALLKFTPDLSEIVPDLATGMPEQPDDVTYTFSINPDARWQDVEPVNGRAFTAEDVKYSIERQMTDEAGTFQHAYFFLGKMDSIDVLDEHTIQFKTDGPYAPFMSYIASPWTLMVNREAVEEYGDVTEHAPGTGPYIFEEWQRDVSIRLRRNPNYWKQDQFGNQLPYIDELLFQIVTDDDTAATLFVDGEVDGAVVGINQTERVQNGRPDANYRGCAEPVLAADADDADDAGAALRGAVG